jgi:hypothetical protein
MGKEKDTGPLPYDLDAPAHTLPFEDVLQKLSVSHDGGLSDDEAKKRRDLYGPNQLDEGPGVRPFRILVHQVANALTLVGNIIRSGKPLLISPAGSDNGRCSVTCHQVMD